MPLTRQEVEHIARLARLELSEDEILRFQRQLSDILDYAARLGKLDTSSVPPTTSVATASVLPLDSVLRVDEPGDALERATLLKNAPHTQEGQFRVPPVRDES